MFLVGAYLRLSKEDGDKETSDSITNQKSLIEKFVDKLENAIIVDYFIDDGFSGLSFDRPGFNRMLKEVLKGSVNTIITKDMSRLGRDRLETGNYIEKIFPMQKVRYISVLDNYDSLTGSNVDIAPFKGLIDEMYAKDISRKVKGAFDTKRMNGEFIGAFAPYGYSKDPCNKNKLIIDSEAASVVKRIFSLFVSGMSILSVAKTLNAEGIPCPTIYKTNTGSKYHNNNRLTKTRFWTHATVNKMLMNEVYIGSMVQKKTEQIFKTNGKKISLDKSKHIIVPNMHEPIIEQEVFDQAQEIKKVRTRKLKSKEGIAPYAGKMFCADCERTMNRVSYPNYTYYKCGSHRKFGIDICSPHTIREDVINSIVINAIRDEAKMALSSRDIDTLKISISNSMDNKTSTEIEKLNRKITSFAKYKKKLYEDYSDGILSKEEYLTYKKEYDEDEAQSKQRISELKDIEASQKGNILKYQEYVERFIKFADIDEVTREISVELIEWIKIYEDNKVDIKFKFINPLL